MIHRLLILLLAGATLVVAQQPVPSPTPAPVAPSEAAAAYDALLEKVKKSDPAVDFQALRLAYTETKAYGPYGGDAEARKNMFAALRANEYSKVLDRAMEILSHNYMDIMGHFGAFVANRELGHADKSTYHRYVFEGLVNSIKNSGDGKTPETAFVVISTDEEYALFNYLGLRPSGQALIKDKGHSFDKMTAVDPKTNASVVYYFNIDKPFDWLGKTLKN
jgi:Domain of unknown function (DUF4919)